MTHAEQLIRAPGRKARWSERELNLLKELYPVEDTELVAAKIGRPIPSVQKMAQMMGVRKGAAALSAIRRERALRQDGNAGRFVAKHGLATAKNKGELDPTYSTWLSMHQRCNYAGHKSYSRYGGRGIKVCARWEEFEAFRADMGARPDGMTLGRINNDAHYEPGNCRWETIQQQQRNRSSNRIIAAFGQELALCEWSERTGISAGAIAKRLQAGWSVERALSSMPRIASKTGPDGLKRWKVVKA